MDIKKYINDNSSQASKDKIKKIYYTKKLLAFMLIVSFVIWYILVGSFAEPPFISHIIGVIILFCIFGYIFLLGEFTSIVNNIVIEAYLLKHPNTKYLVASPIEETYYAKSNILPDYIDISTYNYFNIPYNNLNIEVSGIRIKSEYKNSKSVETKSTTSYTGMFGKVDLPNNYNNALIIRKKTGIMDEIVSSTLNKESINIFNIIKKIRDNDNDLDEFEKEYEVLSQNVNINNLNIDIENAILDFNNITGYKIELSIIDNVLFFKIPMFSFFNVSFNSKNIDDKEIENNIILLDQLCFLAQKIIDSLQEIKF